MKVDGNDHHPDPLGHGPVSGGGRSSDGRIIVDRARLTRVVRGTIKP